MLFGRMGAGFGRMGSLGTGGGSAPAPDPGDVANRAHLSSDARTEAEAIEAHFAANDWLPDLASVSWDDTVAIADGGELYRWLRNNLAIGGVTLNPTRNQRIQLAAGGDFSFTAANQTGGGTPGICEIRGRNFIDNGKVLLIEPATTSPSIRQRFLISGSRGIYFRGLDIVGGLDDWSLDWENFAPLSLHTLTITNGGTGYVTGESLTFTGTYDQAPVGTIIATAGVVTGVNITFGGKVVRNPSGGASLISSIGVSSAGGSGATFSVPSQQASPRDTYAVQIQRNASFPLLPVVVFENNHIGKGHVGTNPQQFACFMTVTNAEQVSLIGNVFRGCQTVCSASTVRRVRFHRNDMRENIGDGLLAVNTATTNAVSGGSAFNVVYPDGLVYTWSRLNVMRAVIDDNARTNAQGEDLRFDQEHTDFVQHGTSGDQGGYRRLIEFNAIYLERETWQDRNNSYRNNTASTLRVTGGTQGTYEDDCGPTFNIDGVVHSNAIFVNTPNGITVYNGTSYVERNTIGRVGRMAPSATTGVDGFNYSQDFNPDLTGKKHSAPATSTLNSRDNILGALTNIAAPQNVVVNQAGDVVADPRLSASAPNQYVDRFSGTFSAVNGLTGYTMQDDGLNTPAAFRAALYAQFTPIGDAVGKGIPDPSLWPAT